MIFLQETNNGFNLEWIITMARKSLN